MLEENNNPEKYKNIHCRMYKNKYPDKDDHVYVKLVEKRDNGFIASLLEYDNITGFLFTKDISSLKIKNPNSLLNLGKELVLKVIQIDVKNENNNGSVYIDLSKKEVNLDEEEKIKKKFRKSKLIEGIIKKLSVVTNTTMKNLYKTIIWPLYEDDSYEHPYDALESIVLNGEGILEGLKIKNEIKEELIKILKNKIVIKPVQIKSQFNLTCFTFNGIDDIKEALFFGQKRRTEDIFFKFYIISSPIYECGVETLNKRKGIEVMNEALEDVKNKIEEKGGNFELIREPHVIDEKDKSIKEQIKEANSSTSLKDEEETEYTEEEE
jgi:translation initiation factor 2 subunit 1